MKNLAKYLASLKKWHPELQCYVFHEPTGAADAGDGWNYTGKSPVTPEYMKCKKEDTHAQVQWVSMATYPADGGYIITAFRHEGDAEAFRRSLHK